jgi:hypothetical protein
MLGWGWPLFANSSGNEGEPVAAATPQLVGPATAGRLLPRDIRAFGEFFAVGPSRTGIFGGGDPPSLSAQR